MNPFIPHALPVDNLDYSQLITQVGEAHAKLAEYSGLLQGMLNPAFMLSPFTQHEAGQIFDDEKETDIRDILNYRKALMLSQDYLKGGRSITLSLVHSYMIFY